MKKRPKKSAPREPLPVRRDGALCAAFVNTASPRRRPLEGWDDLIAWGRRSGVLGDAEAEGLEPLAEDPEAAGSALRRVERHRALLARILGALAGREAPYATDLAALNAALGRASRRLVAAAAGGYRWVWSHRGDEIDRLLLPILVSAADLLACDDHRRVRRCGGQGCDLLFVDRTPGSHRRWCDKASCGDRARSRRRYRKTVKPRRDERRKRRYSLLG